MKKFLIAVALGITTLVATAPAEAQVNQRQWRQQERIHNGYRNGSLNRREAFRLEQQQRRINRYEARSRWSGGHLDRYERVRLHRMQNRASRNIYNQRHDYQRRYRHW